jgi:SnoaL-like domain
VDRADLERWVSLYERAWRTEGTDLLADLFAKDATYLMAPFEEPHRGLDAIRTLWDAERQGPDEEFEMDSEIVAVDGDVGVLRVEVRYGRPQRDHFRDLWIVRFDDAGRCVEFEEWPFAPR